MIRIAAAFVLGLTLTSTVYANRSDSEVYRVLEGNIGEFLGDTAETDKLCKLVVEKRGVNGDEFAVIFFPGEHSDSIGYVIGFPFPNRWTIDKTRNSLSFESHNRKRGTTFFNFEFEPSTLSFVSARVSGDKDYCVFR